MVAVASATTRSPSTTSLEVFATDNLCTHAQACLTDGTLSGDIVECPLHGGAAENRRKGPRFRAT
jgi:hypothetical protein